MGLREALAAEIERRDITQSQAAEEMGVGDSPLSKWLGANPPRPSSESCRKIAAFLRMSLNDVMRLAGHLPMENGSTVADVQTDPEWELMQRELRDGWRATDQIAGQAARRPAVG